MRLTLIAALLAASLAWAAGPPPAPPEGARGLIARLGDDDLATRRAAMRKLEGMGEAVVPALRRVGRGHADVDVRLRAHAVAGAIEAKLYGELKRFEGHTEGVIALAVSPDGKVLASGAWQNGTDRLVRLWDVKTGKNFRSLQGHAGSVVAVAFLPDGKRLLSGSSDRTMRLWEVATGKEVRQYAHSGMAQGIAVSGDGKTAVTCCDSDASLYLWDIEKGKLLRRLSGHSAPSRGVARVPGQDRCLSASWDGSVRLWDVKERRNVKKEKEIARLPHGLGQAHGQAAWFVAARPDGKQAASVGQDGQLRFWDLKTHKLIRAVEAHSQQGSHGVAYSADGKRVVTCGYVSDHSVRLWDADSGKALTVAFLPDGRRAVSGGYDKTIRLWGLRR